MTAAALALREATFDPLRSSGPLLRRLAEATAHPGAVVPLGDIPITLPPPRLRSASALLLALLDRETSVHVHGTHTTSMRDYLRFNTGARASDIEDADFVLVTGGGLGRDARRVGVRSEFSSTVIYAPLGLRAGAPEARGLSTDDDIALLVVGVGVPRRSTLFVNGVAREDFDALRGSRHGIGLWFASLAGGLAALPPSATWRPLV
jgi:hypothetical protein